MNRAVKAYKLKDSDWVVTDKNLVKGATEEDFEEMELTVVIPSDQIKKLNELIERDNKNKER